MTLGEFRAATELYGDDVELLKARNLSEAEYPGQVERLVIEIADTPGEGTSTAIILI